MAKGNKKLHYKKTRAYTIFTIIILMTSMTTALFTTTISQVKANSTGSIQINCYEHNADPLDADTIILYNETWQEYDRATNTHQHLFSNLPDGIYHVEAYEWNMYIASQSSISIESGETKEYDLYAHQKVNVNIYAYYNDCSTPHPSASITIKSYNGELATWDVEYAESLGTDGTESIAVYPTTSDGELYNISVSTMVGNLLNIIFSEEESITSEKNYEACSHNPPPDMTPGNLTVNIYEHDGTTTLNADTIIIYNSQNINISRCNNKSTCTFTDLYPGIYHVEAYEMNQLIAEHRDIEITSGTSSTINMDSNEKKHFDIFVWYEDEITPYNDGTVKIESFNGEYDVWHQEIFSPLEFDGHIRIDLYPTTISGEKYRMTLYENSTNTVLKETEEFTITTDEQEDIIIAKKVYEITNLSPLTLKGGEINKINVTVKNNGISSETLLVEGYSLDPQWNIYGDDMGWNIIEEIAPFKEKKFTFDVIPHFKGGETLLYFNLKPFIFGPTLDQESFIVSADRIQLNYDQQSSEIGYNFRLSLNNTTRLVNGDFSFPISIGKVEKVNPGDEIRISSSYESKKPKIEIFIPETFQDIIDNVLSNISYENFLSLRDDVLDFLSNDLADKLFEEIDKIVDDKIEIEVMDESIIEKNWYSIEPFDVEEGIVHNLIRVYLPFFLGIDADVQGVLFCDGPATILTSPISFKQREDIHFTVDENAKPGEEIDISLVPIFNASMNISFQIYGEYRAFLGGEISFDWKEFEIPENKLHLYPFNNENYETEYSPDTSEDVIGFSCVVNYPPEAVCGSEESYVAFTDEQITFDATKSNDPDGSIISYSWDFGDGISSTQPTVTHSYKKPGEYTVKLTVVDDTDANDTCTATAFITQANRPPSKPVIHGENQGHTNTDYEYTFVSTDLDNHNLSYYIDWGDEENIETKFYGNGSIISRNHSWNSPGEYTIQAYTSDNQTFSETTEYTVLIDACCVSGLINGLLVDEDSDGTYDGFFDSAKETTFDIQKKNDGSYNIDSDGDGKWDYSFDLTSGLHKIKKSDTSTPGFTLGTLIILFMSMLIFTIKRKP